MKEKISNRVKAHTRYKLSDGSIVPGASTIAGLRDKPYLVKWSNNLGLAGIDSTKYKDEKADIGTLTHYRILCDLKNEKENLDEYSKLQINFSDNCMLSYYEWKKKHTIIPIVCELPLISEVFRFGGTIDLYARIDNMNELIDFKTGKAIYDSHWIQLAGYEILLLENKYNVCGRRILNIPRAEDEKFNELSETTKRIEIWKREFKDLLDVYYCEKKLKKGD